MFGFLLKAIGIALVLIAVGGGVGWLTGHPWWGLIGGTVLTAVLYGAAWGFWVKFGVIQ
tara:strand:- start:1791 stop:1967 length:177 start_codon:yes stop_codon:yes gene_type:complete